MIKIPQIQSSGFNCDWADSDFENARRQLRNHKFIKFESFIAPHLHESIKLQLRSAEFEEKNYGVVTDECMKDNRLASLLQLLLNDPKIYTFIETLTHLAPVQFFNGRVYRMRAGAMHHHHWHDDMNGLRLAALSINLSLEDYAGGDLEIRSAATEALISTVSNTGFGDAVLFSIADELQHRVKPVVSHSKIAFAGWFENEADPLTWTDAAKKARHYF